ncbi:ABC transporter transmembrane domain-containing protein [Roseobacter weihaiensis]|uniref:ABC transporter transmembrane domain-containing protein n=1 Tax=Roseobacter weihaiensis TaxID=2763262 RepID=UPI001D0A8D05|nr:ABC transporter ATP-binding protein [Roseobacter sp. H9]
MQHQQIIKIPREVRKTGDDTAAASLLTYVWRMSEWHQGAVCLIAVVVAVLSLIPLELQRRIVNEVVETQNLPVLVQFGIAYVVVVLLHQAVKYGLWIYQSWITESASLYTRQHLLRLYAVQDEYPEEGRGRTVSIVGAEVEKLGGFVGEALSDACANAAILLGVAVYMFVVEPQIAVFALAFLVPQVVLTPLIQRKLNALIETRVGLLRNLGDQISEMGAGAEMGGVNVLRDIYSNRIRYFLLKFAMKAVLNLLNALGPMTVLLFGGYLVMQGEVQIGVIVAFISGFERISSPLRELIGFYRVAAQANVQHRLIAEWMAELRRA